jgi:Transposase DDE domain group 1
MPSWLENILTSSRELEAAASKPWDMDGRSPSFATNLCAGRSRIVLWSFGVPFLKIRSRLDSLTLFKDRKYAYHVLVTNLTAHPWRVWQFYAKRATIEKNIRELLYDYPLGKIPTDDWTANVAFFQILLFAYNLVHWFKRLCLPKEYLYATLDTIRTDFLVLPAKLTKEGSKNVLVLPHDYHYQKEFTNALKTIDRLRLP